MIVYYYGGCCPCEPLLRVALCPAGGTLWVMSAYITQASSATGFGQKWASRHVNTAGKGPAEDIIEGIEKVCEIHRNINPKKIDCMGASYGGFMTR